MPKGEWNTPESSGAPQTAPVYESFEESAYSRGFEVDHKNKVLKGVRVLGLHSQNDGGNREYSEDAVAKCIKLYEGKPGFLSHKGNKPWREFDEKLGIHRNPRPAPANNPGIITDFHLNPHHRLCESILWEAEQPDSDVGFSHVCEGRVSRKNGKVIVDEIVKVSSVDLVCSPATVKNFREGVESGDLAHVAFCEHGFSAISDAAAILRSTETVEAKTEKLLNVLSVWTSELSETSIKQGVKPMEWSDITVASLKEHRQDLYDSIQGNDELSKRDKDIKRLSESLESKEKELAEAKERIKAIESENANKAKRIAVIAELQNAGVTSEKVCTESAVDHLCTIDDEATRKSIVEIMVMAQRGLNDNASGYTSAPFSNLTPTGKDTDDPTNQETLPAKRWR